MSELRYTDSHEWIKVDGKTGLVGITDHAQSELGDIVYVELPSVGKDVKAGDAACVLESTKAAADVFSPASGRIIAINSDVTSRCELVNQAAATTWLFKIELSNPAELNKLMSSAAYEQMLAH